jgi:hypothetical protein
VAPSICHLSWGGEGYRVLPWSDPMIRVVGLWNPLLIWAGPGPPNLSYIHIRLIDEALFQSLHRPFRCGRHRDYTQFFIFFYIPKLVRHEVIDSNSTTQIYLTVFLILCIHCGHPGSCRVSALVPFPWAGLAARFESSTCSSLVPSLAILLCLLCPPSCPVFHTPIPDTV